MIVKYAKKNKKNRKKLRGFYFESGGEGGIRTHGGLAPTPDFESGTFDHSATSPGRKLAFPITYDFNRSVTASANLKTYGFNCFTPPI